MEKCVNVIVNFFVRALLGMAMIFFVNEWLFSKGMDAGVGMNVITFLTSGAFGFPGIILLYGIGLY